MGLKLQLLIQLCMLPIIVIVSVWLLELLKLFLLINIDIAAKLLYRCILSVIVVVESYRGYKVLHYGLVVSC